MPLKKQIDQYTACLKSMKSLLSSSRSSGGLVSTIGSFFTETCSQAYVLKTDPNEYLKAFSSEFLAVIILQLDSKIYPAVLYQEVINSLSLLFRGFKSDLSHQLRGFLGVAQEIIDGKEFEVLNLSPINMRGYTLSKFMRLEFNTNSKEDETITVQFIGNSEYCSSPKLLCDVAHKTATKALEQIMHQPRSTVEAVRQKPVEKARNAASESSWYTLPTLSFTPAEHDHKD